MTRSTLAGRSALLLLCSLSPACSLLGSGKSGVYDLNELVDRVERLHVDAELSKARSGEALSSLRSLVAPDFRGDALLAFDRLLDAIERSEDQADAFASTLDDVEDSAEDVFDEWEESLEDMTNETFRARSESRLADTRNRFEAVLVASRPVGESYGRFNSSLRDHALFLEHDLNPTSVAMLAKDVSLLSDRATELEQRLDACMAASDEYVRSSALPGQVLTQASR